MVEYTCNCHVSQLQRHYFFRHQHQWAEGVTISGLFNFLIWPAKLEEIVLVESNEMSVYS